MAQGTINLHGHSHGRLNPLTRQFDVGVDVRDFQPITLAALMEGMDKCRLQRAACHLVRKKLRWVARANPRIGAAEPLKARAVRGSFAVDLGIRSDKRNESIWKRNQFTRRLYPFRQ